MFPAPLADRLRRTPPLVPAGLLLILMALANPMPLKGAQPRADSDHWSLQPVQRPDLPSVEESGWPRNPVDAFVLAELEDADLAPSPEADRRRLIRRLSFNLIGLPPTPEEVEHFVSDNRPDAYERLVDRLLASPHYGERWARHWLDVARYSESHGYERDQGRYNAWPYRDYVIDAFNADKPYDQFIREQIAGDVIEPITREGMIAAGFLVAGPWDQVGSDQQSELGRAHIRENELEDLLATVGQGFMGVTLNCARCHDHLYDPVPMEDYYRIKAVFDGVRHGERRVGTPEQLASEEEDLLVAYVGRREQPAPTRVLERGDPGSPGEEVTPAGLSVIEHPSAEFGLAADAPEAERRPRLAEWMAHPDHPLTARVMVNRVWHYHFGTGIVATPNDFGGIGDRPSHPELLDYLADWFVENDWSVKALHRLIVTSATYRQASGHREGPAAVDAENRLLWRFAPRRLEAEAIRDAQLAWSDQLNRSIGGESFQPFELYVRGGSGHYYLLEDRKEPEYNRRTIYRMHVISGKDPLLEAFDCPDPGSRTPVRRATVTPLQALGLMNNAFVQRQVDHFAERVLAEAGEDAAAAADLAYRYVFGRSPTPVELERAADLVEEHGLSQLGWVLFNASEALYVR